MIYRRAIVSVDGEALRRGDIAGAGQEYRDVASGAKTDCTRFAVRSTSLRRGTCCW